MKKGINLHVSVAQVNQSIAELNDSLGVPRTFTLPYTDGHDMAAHVKAVDVVAQEHGGLMMNLLSSYHHEGKRGYGSSDGETVGHPVDKLQNTLIPKDFVPAIKAIGAARTLVTKCASLVGADDPAILRARSQLGLLSRSNAALMNLFDFDSMIQFVVSPAVAAVAKAHHHVKVAHAGGKPIGAFTPARHGMPQPEETGEEEETQSPEQENSDAQPQTQSQAPASAPSAQPQLSGLSQPGNSAPQAQQ